MAIHRRRKEVLDSLARIEGHIRGVRRMVEEGRPCPDLLLQIAAIRSAVNRVGRILMEDHLESCLVEAARTGEMEAYLSDLREALSRLF